MNSGPRPSRDEWAMSMAVLTAKRATCLRRAVGCVLLNGRGHVLATGYNGVAAGRPHCNQEYEFKVLSRRFIGQQVSGAGVKTGPRYPHACPGSQSESGTNLDACEAIHAEQNALLQCPNVYDIHTAYVTASPCVTCTKLLLNTGCQRIVFLEEYPAPAARELWVSAGRSWEKY